MSKDSKTKWYNDGIRHISCYLLNWFCHAAVEYETFKQYYLGKNPNPPPNLACRYFTHSTETIIWVAKTSKSKHFFNYKLMKESNDNRQMKDVWNFTAPRKNEKSFGSIPHKNHLIYSKGFWPHQHAMAI